MKDLYLINLILHVMCASLSHAHSLHTLFYYNIEYKVFIIFHYHDYYVSKKQYFSYQNALQSCVHSTFDTIDITKQFKLNARNTKTSIVKMLQKCTAKYRYSFFQSLLLTFKRKRIFAMHHPQYIYSVQ